MAEKLSDHPILLYVTFVLPLLLLLLGAIFNASVFLLIVLAAWIGIAMFVLFLPIASDNGSSS